MNYEGGGANAVSGLSRGLELIAKSPLGYIWNLPNTALGLAWGALGFVAEVGSLPFTRKWDFKINLGNNAIQFNQHPLMFLGDITIGNTIHYSSDLPQGSSANGYGRSVPVEIHESAHTYQQQLLGPTFIPAYFLLGGAASSNPFEIGADNYALGNSWLPSKNKK